VHLSYTRATGAEQCPDESALREAVLARLGYDPFDARAPRVLSAKVRRAGGSFVAHIELRDASGQVQGERDLRAEGSDCAELATAIALAVSLGIDPLSAAAPPNAPAPATAVVPTPPVENAQKAQVVIVRAPAPPSAPPPAPAPPGIPLHPRFGVGAMLSWGISPAIPAYGATVDAGVRRGLWSLDLEGAGNWSKTATDGSIGVRSSLVLASLAPCVHLGIAMGCALGGMGSLAASGVTSSPQSAHALFADAGVRLGVEVPLGRRFFAQVHADGLATFTHVTYRLDGQTAWNTPPFSASLGVEAGFEL
jgi:hypothetical protein